MTRKHRLGDPEHVQVEPRSSQSQTVCASQLAYLGRGLTWAVSLPGLHSRGRAAVSLRAERGLESVLPS